ncbi:hypothetical protein [Nocardia brasiliensis]|uniref:hypothetical protein n=1 Tax=Nocardia brasiliensis TaxID=37326 RepID=UPI002458295E|nr:hypothetical protein [Nocardia brasiliensis]
MDIQTEDAVAAAIRKVDPVHDLGSSALAEALLAELAESGYELVRLPAPAVDDDFRTEWPVPEINQWAGVFLRQSDGRVGLDGVPTPLESRQAFAVAAALIAAARHVQEAAE